MTSSNVYSLKYKSARLSNPALSYKALLNLDEELVINIEMNKRELKLRARSRHFRHFPN